MGIQEINQRIDTLTEELEKLKTLRNQEKKKREDKEFNITLVFHTETNFPGVMFLHTDRGIKAIKTINELIEECSKFPKEKEEEFNGFMAFLKDIMDSRNDND